jgi:hypothetical protein
MRNMAAVPSEEDRFRLLVAKFRLQMAKEIRGPKQAPVESMMRITCGWRRIREKYLDSKDLGDPASSNVERRKSHFERSLREGEEIF